MSSRGLPNFTALLVVECLPETLAAAGPGPLEGLAATEIARADDGPAITAYHRLQPWSPKTDPKGERAVGRLNLEWFREHGVPFDAHVICKNRPATGEPSGHSLLTHRVAWAPSMDEIWHVARRRGKPATYSSDARGGDHGVPQPVVETFGRQYGGPADAWRPSPSFFDQG
jgi:hypothetical protein